MDSLDGFGRWGSGFAKGLVLAVALAVGLYLAAEHWRAPPGPQALLQKANPGWLVEKPRHAGLVVKQPGGPDLVIDADDAGDHPLARHDCAALRAALPEWLALPPGQTQGCLRLGEAAATAQVLNHLTPEPIPQLWEQRYGPRVQALKLRHSGGWSGGGPDGPARPEVVRKHRSMGYAVEPAPGSTGPRAGLLAFYQGDQTLLVVTLRP